MKGIGNRLNKYYKKVKSTFFRLVNDIRNIKGIGIYSLLKRNKVSISILISCIIVLGVALVENNLSKEEFLNKCTDYFYDYDYIVGDIAYGKLRLKGFYSEKNKKVKSINNYKFLDKYLKNNCAVDCKYFVLQKERSE